MTKSPHNIEDSFGCALGRSFRAVANHLNRHFVDAGFDITCEQFSVLRQLATNDGQTLGQLTDHTNKDKTTITRSVDGLEKRGLVKRIAGQVDGRQKKVFLTSKGKTFYQKLSRLMSKAMNSAQKNIKVKDLDFCKKVLDQIYSNVTKSL